MNRREFLGSAAIGMGTAGVISSFSPLAAIAAEYTKPSRMRLGLVTYNLAADWDVPTIIKNCEATRFEGVELRTTHAHKVEVSLTPTERREVKKRFADSKVGLMGLGSAFDYHTPDQAKLRKDIESTKEYIVLAEDVGASGVKVRPNGLPKEVPVEKTLEQIGMALREIGAFARDHGQTVRLEVHGSGTSFPPHIHRIIQHADHPNVGVCWNSNATDHDGQGWDYNFNLLKDRIVSVHLTDLFLENYPYRKLLNGLNAMNYTGFCLAEIPASSDPTRVMRYYRALWLAYQDLL
jgi:sugar phosphate isomerase/epimerase